MTNHPNRSRWIIVPRDYISHGAPKHGMHGNRSFSSEAAAWAYIEREIARLEATVPETGDGADYLACRIAELECLTVANERTLRERTDDKARSLHRRFPQFYDRP